MTLQKYPYFFLPISIFNIVKNPILNMTDKKEVTIPLRILVDREKNRVSFAEACKDFMDTLLSFLSLPMGTIVNLVDTKCSQPAQAGCINNLYQSVQDLSTENLSSGECKSMLLNPRNILAPYCRDLKINLDNTEPIKYFICSDIFCSRKKDGLLSTYKNIRCHCGQLLDKEIELKAELKETESENGVFLKGVTMFIISDDLNVTPSSPRTWVNLLSNAGVKNVNDLEERVVDVQSKEIADLLKHSLISKCPLTEVFLQNPKSSSNTTPNESILQYLSQDPNVDGKSNNEGNSSKISLKLLRHKSDKKVLFAEAKDDFVNLLFSFLTIPLGSMLKLDDGKSSMGCIDNFYKSVVNLNSELLLPLNHKKLDINLELFNYTKDLVLNSGVPPFYGIKNNLLDINEQKPCVYYCYTNLKTYYLTRKKLNLKYCSEVLMPLTLKDPKKNGGYMQSPGTFIVKDNLEVVAMSNSSFSFLKKLETPTDDFEEHEISFGKEEALKLLKACLISKCALTMAFPSFLKIPKQEP